MSAPPVKRHMKIRLLDGKEYDEDADIFQWQPDPHQLGREFAVVCFPSKKDSSIGKYQIVKRDRRVVH